MMILIIFRDYHIHNENTGGEKKKDIRRMGTYS